MVKLLPSNRKPEAIQCMYLHMNLNTMNNNITLYQRHNITYHIWSSCRLYGPCLYFFMTLMERQQPETISINVLLTMWQYVFIYMVIGW